MCSAVSHLRHFFGLPCAKTKQWPQAGVKRNELGQKTYPITVLTRRTVNETWQQEQWLRLAASLHPNAMPLHPVIPSACCPPPPQGSFLTLTTSHVVFP